MATDKLDQCCFYGKPGHGSNEFNCGQSTAENRGELSSIQGDMQQMLKEGTLCIAVPF
jgi:hypothetical protein